MKRQIISTFLMLLGFSLIVPNAMSIDESRPLVYGETGRVDSFDPYTIHEASGQRLSDLLFNSLVAIGPGGDYIPELAKSWDIGEGGSFVIFELRDKVQWHGSKEKLKGQDVATTVRLLLAPDSEIPNKERFSSLKSVELISPTKIKILLKRAMSDPLRVMMFKVLPDHELASLPALKRNSKFAVAPIGTGPYKFRKANDQGEVLLDANGDYFTGKPKIAKLLMKAYADQSVMAQSLMFNSLDLITYVSARDLGEIVGDKQLSVVPYDALSFTFFAFNTSRGILKDKRVRQGLTQALNRNEMLSAFFSGKGQIISGPFPPTSWAYNLDVKPIPFDVKKARSLFEASGLKDSNQDGFYEDRAGKEIKLQFAVPMTGEGEMIKRIVLAFQEYLSTAGIKVELQFMDWLVWKKKVLGAHDYDVTIASWSFDDASNITSLFHSSSAVAWDNNFVLFRNAEVDSLLTEADSTSDYDKRRAIYQKLHAILADEAPYAYLWTLMHHAAHSSRVVGVRVEPFSFFKYVASWNLKK